MSDIHYETVIGLEVHVQLKTDSKLFCRCSTTFGSPPNTQVCPVCLGQPGSLPVINASAIDIAIRAGLGMNCEIARFTKWDRKNYFYPDLPKGYQISQFDLPICGEGFIEIEVQDDAPKKIRLIRAHLEEDAGKSLHDEKAGRGSSRIDLNRTGTPLLEIVSQPDLRSAEEAKAYLNELKMLMEFLDISDCNMQEGSLRVDANVNLHISSGGKVHETPIVEVKNLNSFRAVERAIQYEQERQLRNWLENGLVRGQAPKQTVGWDDALGQTIVQREKEDSADYRYFPDPDLIPVSIEEARIEEVRANLVELPRERRKRFENQYSMRAEDAVTICSQGKGVADFLDAAVEAGAAPKRVTSWILQDVLRTLNDRQISIGQFPLTAKKFAELLQAIELGSLDTTRGREVFQYLLQHPQDSIDASIAALGIKQVDSSEIESICKELLDANPDVVAKVKDGNVKALGALVGQAKKKNPNADPRQVQDICVRIIKELP